MSFELAVKSTIDWTLKQLAQANGFEYLDLDTAYLTSDVFESDAPAIGWSMIQIGEAPLAPMWSVDFRVDCKTSQDPAQYLSFDMTSLVAQLFKVGERVEIRDYSDALLPLSTVGALTITGCSTAAMEPDRVAGFRPTHISGMILQWP